MAFNLGEFKREAERIDRELSAESLRAFKRWSTIVLHLHSDLVRLTPLDTGMAKAGWVLTRTRPSGFRPSFAPKIIAKAAGRERRSGILPAYQTRIEMNAEEARQRVDAAVQIFRENRVSDRGTAQLKGSGLDRRRVTFFISNHVPYIEVLDSGTGSPQAPSGMSRPALAKARRELQAAVDRRG